MSSGISVIFLLLMFFSGGRQSGTDLLDALSTDAYWQVKHVTVSLDQLQRDASPDKPPENIDKLVKDLSADDFKMRDDAKKALESMGPSIVPQLKTASESKDPEVAAVAQNLITRFLERGQERAVRRLMAIRTLGERKEKDALPLLKSLLDSREPFVADYAKQAMAQIQGDALAPADHGRALQQDLALLPEKLSIVCQARGIARQPLTLAALVDMVAGARNPLEGMLPNMPGGAAPPPLDKKRMLTNATLQVLKVIDKIGNARVDGVTVGVADNIGPGGGSAVIIVRGEYNAAAAYAALKALAAGEGAPANDRVKAWSDGAINFLEPDPSTTLIFPSNEQFILVAGDEKDKAAALDTTLAALKAGRGGLADNKDLAALIKTVDTTAPVWGVLKANDAMKKDPPIQPLADFDTLTLQCKPTPEGVAFTFKGQGPDADKVKASVDALAKDLATGLADVQQQVAQNKEMQPVVDLVASIKVVAEGKNATLTGEIKATIIKAMFSEMGFLVAPLLQDPEPDKPGGAPAAAAR